MQHEDETKIESYRLNRIKVENCTPLHAPVPLLELFMITIIFPCLDVEENYLTGTKNTGLNYGDYYKHEYAVEKRECKSQWSDVKHGETTAWVA